jgi:hypothetical protein
MALAPQDKISLPPLEEILKEFPDLDEKGRNLAQKLYAALNGEVKRDVQDNDEDPMSPERLAKFTEGFAAFVGNEEKMAFLTKK